ncbi:MAG: hypothetical protein RL885_04935 [Planctomycetota bacterium]
MKAPVGASLLAWLLPAFAGSSALAMQRVDDVMARRAERLELALDELERVCDIDAEQKKELRAAGNRWVNGEKFAEVIATGLKAMLNSDSAATPNGEVLVRRPIGDPDLWEAWSGELKRVLRADQREVLAAAHAMRETTWRRGFVASLVGEIDRELRTSQEQRIALEEAMSAALDQFDNRLVPELASAILATAPQTAAALLLSPEAVAETLSSDQLWLWRELRTSWLVPFFSRLHVRLVTTRGDFRLVRNGNRIEVIFQKAAVDPAVAPAPTDILERELAYLERVCDLSLEQRRKLEILGKSVIHGSSGSIPFISNEVSMSHFIEVKALRDYWKRRFPVCQISLQELGRTPFYERDRWLDASSKLLTEEQREAIRRDRAERSRYRRSATGTSILASLDEALLLDETQRAELEVLIERMLEDGANDRLPEHVFHLDRPDATLSTPEAISAVLTLPVEAIEPILSLEQLEVWRYSRETMMEILLGPAAAKAPGQFHTEWVKDDLHFFFEPAERR